jgi:hypothetical protein
MHEDYDDNDDYDDDDYSQDKFNSDKHWFKFDPSIWNAWGKYLDDALKDIVDNPVNVWYVQGFPFKSIPVNSWNPNAGQGNSFQYLGSNYQGQEIWKSKYFVLDPISISYKNHIQSHATHFLQQPNYYKGMFDILN